MNAPANDRVTKKLDLGTLVRILGDHYGSQTGGTYEHRQFNLRIRKIEENVTQCDAELWAVAQHFDFYA